MGVYEITVFSEFSAAHQLLNYQGNCSRLHGHNWRVELTIRGMRLNASGILFDFRTLKEELKKFLDLLDHRVLNEVPELNGLSPSAEVLAQRVADEVQTFLMPYCQRIYRARIWENDRSVAAYYPNGV